MNNSIKQVYRQLDNILEKAHRVSLEKHSRLVIFSDLHMGNGGKNDDFLPNEPLFTTALKDYYLKNDYSLVLNGDIEELQRYSMEKIWQKWEHVFGLFDAFNQKQKLFKTVGNHDIDFLVKVPKNYQIPIYESLSLDYKDDRILIFHGHQASSKYRDYNKWVGYTLKYVANPLRIKNYSVAHDSRKQYNIEKKAYHYSSIRKIVSIIGHTHRPLFESLAKAERLKFTIEQLCRDYANPEVKNKKNIKKSIKGFKKELKKIHKKQDAVAFRNNLYNSIFNIPCLFNSGCVVGKRGMTCLEIENGEIRLIHWFDKNTNKKYLKYTGYEASALDETDYYRMILNEESLDYIFTRIHLLA